VERRRNASLFTVTAEAPKALPDRTDAAGNIIDIKTSAPVRR
jgi:hypothetical protein